MQKPTWREKILRIGKTLELLLILFAILGIGGLAAGSRSSSGSGGETSTTTYIGTPDSLEETRDQEFTKFINDGLHNSETSIDLAGVKYELRSGEPLHNNFKYQDPNGNWWSPDYKIIVTAGQSNMIGNRPGGDNGVDSNIFVLQGSGSSIQNYSHLDPTFNNLYIPFANKVVATESVPVLVINTAVSGSNIDSWLQSESGSNWANMNVDVAKALAITGQDQVDIFLWHQGEANFSTNPAVFTAKFNELVAQTQGQPWADNLSFLAGEMSREGVNSGVNESLQEIEVSETNPNLAFASSVGLTSDEPLGIHFNGESLFKLGSERYWEAYQNVLAERANPGSTGTSNTAPEITQTPQTTLIATSEVSYSIDLRPFFNDAEGDQLFYYGNFELRAVGNVDHNPNGVSVTFIDGVVGKFSFYAYSSDYYLDSKEIEFSFIVTPETIEPSTSIARFSDNELSAFEAQHSTFSVAIANAEDGNALLSTKLDTSAVNSTLNLNADNVLIDSNFTTNATFIFGADVKKITLAGSDNFSVVGNSERNDLLGNDGDNTLSGGAEQDRLFGGDGLDTLFGGTENDVIFGGNGADQIYGGLGSDQAYGGDGADTYHMSEGDGLLQLRDMASKDDGDVIKLVGFAGIDDYADLIAAANIVENTTVGRLEIEIGTDRLFIYDLDEDDLKEDMFLIV